jgi:hypothetical protein
VSLFYFVGGPKTGKAPEFFRRLEEAGGPPDGWAIYPHASGDGRALHLVTASSAEPILEHLRRFEDVYERDEIIEVRAPAP